METMLSIREEEYLEVAQRRFAEACVRFERAMEEKGRAEEYLRRARERYWGIQTEVRNRASGAAVGA